MQVGVTVNKEQVNRIKREFANAPKIINRIQVRAVNKTLGNATTYVSQEIRKDLNITAGRLKKHIQVRRKASMSSPGAWFVIEGSRIPIKNFKGVRQGKRGTSWRVRMGGARTSLRDAFFATMRSGHRGVFKRHETEKMKSKPNRAAIFELYGPSVPQVAENLQSLSQAVLGQQMEAFLAKNLGQQLRYELTKD